MPADTDPAETRGTGAKAEFDAFADGYDAGMHDPIKRLAGSSFDVFVAQKVELVKRWLAARNLAGQETRLLDFGCGTGDFLRSMRAAVPGLDLAGCDVSGEMIEQARHRWPELASVELRSIEGGRLLWKDGAFDVVIATCVFHHVMPAQRAAVIREISRVLKAGGWLLIVEHNPWNPLTRYIVKRAPIDANAILLSSFETRSLLAQSSFQRLSSTFFLFVPPRFRRLWPLERFLAWCPLGGQYLVAGQKPKS